MEFISSIAFMLSLRSPTTETSIYKKEANINCSQLEIVLTVFIRFNWQVLV